MQFGRIKTENRRGSPRCAGVFVSPKLRKVLCLPRLRPVSKKLWRKAQARLLSKPVESFPGVYRLPGKETVFCRLQHSANGEQCILVDVSPEVKIAQNLRRRLDFDPLTKLHTRTAFARKVAEKIAKAPEKAGALLFADLDDLKTVNDVFGHCHGDALLQKAGKAFALMAGEEGIAARLSGDEFAVFLHGLENLAAAKAQTLPKLAAVRSYFAKSGDAVSHGATFSAGIAWYPTDGKTLDSLLRRADIAMYQAKNGEKVIGFSHPQ